MNQIGSLYLNHCVASAQIRPSSLDVTYSLVRCIATTEVFPIHMIVSLLNFNSLSLHCELIQ